MTVRRGLLPVWKLAEAGALTRAAALECSDSAVHRALEHGVPISVGGVDVTGPDEGIWRRTGRHRISHQSLSRARHCDCVAGWRDRTPLRGQARCSLWPCPDDR